MSYRGRCQRRREIKEARIQRRIADAIVRRPPRIETRYVAGPAKAFEIGALCERINHATDDPRHATYLHKLNEAPKHRQVVVPLIAGMSAAAFADSSRIAEWASMSHGVFRAVRMRCSVDVDGATNHVEWWTWEPERMPEAYKAVRQARAYLDVSVKMLEDARMQCEHVSSGSANLELQAMRSRLDLIAEHLRVVSSAAGEWLATPELPKAADPKRWWPEFRRSA